MQINQLADVLNVVANEIKDLHFITSDWMLHKQLGKLYDHLSSDYDRVAEQALSHGESIGNPSTSASRVWSVSCPDRNKMDASQSAQEAIHILGLLLYAIDQTKGDIGVLNMTGDLYERYQLWNGFILPHFIQDSIQDPIQETLNEQREQTYIQ